MHSEFVYKRLQINFALTSWMMKKHIEEADSTTEVKHKLQIL